MTVSDEQDKRPIRTIEQPVDYHSVRLVYPLPDPETGVTRDVIVKRMDLHHVYSDRAEGTTRWARTVPGLNITIPWPQVAPKEHKDNDCDTLRLDVETRTFVPTLLRPPMPSTVIDELRNKFSIFRTRHDEDYIAAKMEEDRQKEERKAMLADQMTTPLKEINRKMRKLRKAKGKGSLTPEMMAKLGEAMAKKQQAVLGSMGIEKLSVEA